MKIFRLELAVRVHILVLSFKLLVKSHKNCPILEAYEIENNSHSFRPLSRTTAVCIFVLCDTAAFYPIRSQESQSVSVSI